MIHTKVCFCLQGWKRWGWRLSKSWMFIRSEEFYLRNVINILTFRGNLSQPLRENSSCWHDIHAEKDSTANSKEMSKLSLCHPQSPYQQQKVQVKGLLSKLIAPSWPKIKQAVGSWGSLGARGKKPAHLTPFKTRRVWAAICRKRIAI